MRAVAGRVVERLFGGRGVDPVRLPTTDLFGIYEGGFFFFFFFFWGVHVFMLNVCVEALVSQVYGSSGCVCF